MYAWQADFTKRAELKDSSVSLMLNPSKRCMSSTCCCSRSDADSAEKFLNSSCFDLQNFADNAKFIFHVLCSAAHDVLHDCGPHCRSISPIRSMYRRLSFFVEKCVIAKSSVKRKFLVKQLIDLRVVADVIRMQVLILWLSLSKFHSPKLC